jgi:hypothetical protein
MKAHQYLYPIVVMSDVLNVSSSGYYAWRNRSPSARARRDALLMPHIKAAHDATRHTYGVGRLHSELIANGVTVTALQSKSITSTLRALLQAKETLQMYDQ